jgi:Tol biopolymer transport system component
VSGSASDGLVFVRLVDGVKDLARARLSDGATTAFLPTPAREEDWPYWSQAAGALLLQVRAHQDRALSDLVLWDPKTRAERPVAAAADRDEQWPMWSPNGREVVYAFQGSQPKSGIGVVDVASGVVRLAATAGEVDWFFRPHFAPDGVRIVAQRRRGAGQGTGLWLLQADRPPKVLLDDHLLFYQKPWFTRDGESVVFTMRPVAGGLRDIYAVSASGGEPRAIVSEPGSDDHSALPSPTRDEIVFVSNREGSMDIFRADLDGGNPRNLTHSADRDEYAPHWSPDGERIVVTFGPATPRPPGAGDDIDLPQAHILVMDREGKRLFETPGFMPDWMPPWP